MHRSIQTSLMNFCVSIFWPQLLFLYGEVFNIFLHSIPFLSCDVETNPHLWTIHHLILNITLSLKHLEAAAVTWIWSVIELKCEFTTVSWMSLCLCIFMSKSELDKEGSHIVILVTTFSTCRLASHMDLQMLICNIKAQLWCYRSENSRMGCRWIQLPFLDMYLLVSGGHS